MQTIATEKMTREQEVRKRYYLLTFRRGSGLRRADLNLEYVDAGRWGKKGLHHGLKAIVKEDR